MPVLNLRSERGRTSGPAGPSVNDLFLQDQYEQYERGARGSALRRLDISVEM